MNNHELLATTCLGSIESGWDSISSDSVKCPLCGYVTHWENGREHTFADLAFQLKYEVEQVVILRARRLTLGSAYATT